MSDLAPHTTAKSTAGCNNHQYTQSAHTIRGIRIGGIPYAIAVNSKTNMIYVADRFSKKVSLIDGSRDRLIKTVNLTDHIEPNSLPPDVDLSSTIDVSPLTNLVYAGYTDSSTIFVIDGSEGNIEAYDKVSGNVRSLVADPSSVNVYVATNKIDQRSWNNTVFQMFGAFNSLEPKTKSIVNGSDFVMAIAVNPNLIGKDPSNKYQKVYAITTPGPPGLGVKGGDTNRLYILNSSSEGLEPNLVNTIPITGSKDPQLWDLVVDNNTNDVYLTSHSSSSVYMIDGSMTRVSKIGVRNGPDHLALNPKTGMIYVTDASSNTVSVINGRMYLPRVTCNIIVDANPRGIAVNPTSNIIYTANQLAGTVSVINGSTNNLMIGVAFNVNPPHSGEISCNKKTTLNNSANYNIGAPIKCEAKSNPGFVFSSWSGNLAPISTNTNRPSSIFDPIFNNINNSPPSIEFAASTYGTLGANFVPAPVIIPEGYLIALFGIISSIFVGWFVPNIAHWLNGRKQRKNVREYVEKIEYEHDKLDQHTIEKEITELFTKGKISESQYGILKDKISDYYGVGHQ